MKLALYIVLLLAVAGVIYWLNAVEQMTPEVRERDQVPANVQRIVNAANTLTLDLYGELCDQLATQSSDSSRDPIGNLMCSPFSAYACLHMTYAGAGGQTVAEIAAALNISLEESALHVAMGYLLQDLSISLFWSDCRLQISNRLWGQDGFDYLPEFLDTLDRHYRSELTRVDFEGAPQQAREQINEWIAEQTNRRIVDGLPADAVTELTRLVLTNTMYFLGKWESPFKLGRTKERKFYPVTQDSILVPMMSQIADYNYHESAGIQILEMPYEGTWLAMDILLPRNRDGLLELEQRATTDSLITWLGAMQEEKDVDVLLPKFEFRLRFRLRQILQQFGMESAFGSDADFSRMSADDSLYINEVFQQTFVKVDEEGTEAAVATNTVVGVADVASPRDPIIFHADHPFLFLIRDRWTGTILFIGRVTDPLAAQ